MPTTCKRCKRVLRDRESIAVEEGPTCRKKTLDALTPAEREVEEMRGYTVTQKEIGGKPVFVVTNPADESYIVTLDPPGCDCPAYGRDGEPCKHFRLVLERMDTETVVAAMADVQIGGHSQSMVPAAKPKRSFDEIEREINTAYDKYYNESERRESNASRGCIR